MLILDWPKSFFELFSKILWKNPTNFLINPMLKKKSLSVLCFITPISLTMPCGLWPCLQLQNTLSILFLASYFLTSYFFSVDNSTSYTCFFALFIPPLKNVLPMILCIIDNFLSLRVQLRSHFCRDCYHSDSSNCFTILKISLISRIPLNIILFIYF